MKAGSVAPLPSPGPWLNANLSHERIKAVPKPDVPRLLLNSLGHIQNSRSRGMLP